MRVMLLLLLQGAASTSEGDTHLGTLCHPEMILWPASPPQRRDARVRGDHRGAAAARRPPDRATAAWSARLLELGGQSRYCLLAIGTDGIPTITDREQARREPQLAVLSVIAHGQGWMETFVLAGASASRRRLLLGPGHSPNARRTRPVMPNQEKYPDWT